MKTCFNKPLLLLTAITGFALALAGQLSAQAFTNLYNFTPLVSGTNTDGANPKAGLVLSGNTLCGTSFQGGGSGHGTVFRINMDGTSFTNLYAFSGSDGANPQGDLVLSSNTLYGTTYAGGAVNAGTVFAINTDGSGFTSFSSFCCDGGYPQAGLALSGGTLYGSSSGSRGTLFAISTNGTGFGNFYTFSLLDSGGRNSDGSSPQCRLVVSDSNVYGTAATGGNSGQGAVYCLNPGGSGWWYGCYYLAIGEYPQAGLVLSGNTLYGTCSGPPFGSGGSVFAINTDESNPRLLHNFTGGNDGGKPLAGLILSGNFLFGTTFSGGSSGNGTVFKIKTDGSGFTNLYSFSAVSGTAATNNDGANPQADLVLSGNTLYGTTAAGGTSGNGTVFSISLPVSQLTIIPAGETVLLIWPTNAISFTLQSTTNLASPVWEIVSPAPIVVNMNNVVTNGVSAVQKFYRLTW